MKFVKKEEAQKVINSDTSYLLEYSKKLDDKDMDFCINTIQGRYPEKGYCSNLKCKEESITTHSGCLSIMKTATLNIKSGDPNNIKSSLSALIELLLPGFRKTSAAALFDLGTTFFLGTCRIISESSPIDCSSLIILRAHGLADGLPSDINCSK